MEEEYFEDEIGDDSVYSYDGRENLIDNGEMSSAEEAFMRGYEEAFDWSKLDNKLLFF